MRTARDQHGHELEVDVFVEEDDDEEEEEEQERTGLWVAIMVGITFGFF